MLKNLLFYFLLFFNLGISFGQTAEKVLDQYLEAKNQREDYQAEMNMSIYKGLDGATSYESIDGVIARYKGIMYQSLEEMEMAIGDDFYIKLNKSEKLMAVGLSTKELFSHTGYFDPELLSKFFKEKELKDLGDKWELTLTMANIPNLPIQRIKMLVNKSNFHLYKVVLLYSSLSDFSQYDKHLENPLDFPRMVITYTNYNNHIKLDKERFTKKYYFTHLTNRIIPNQKFQDYKIILLK